MVLEILAEKKVFCFAKRVLRVVTTYNKWLKQALALSQVFEFCGTFKDTFFNRTPHVQCLLLVPDLLFKYIDLSVILY